MKFEETHPMGILNVGDQAVEFDEMWMSLFTPRDICNNNTTVIITATA